MGPQKTAPSINDPNIVCRVPRNVLLIVNSIALGAIYIQAGFNMVEECL